MRRYVTAALLALGCGTFVGPDEKADRVALFEQVWLELDRHYSFFVYKGVDWDSLHGVYAPLAAETSNEQGLAGVIGTMLRELRDVHVNLFAFNQDYRYTGYDSRPVFFDPDVVRTNYVTDRQTAPRQQLAYGHLAADVGYIWIPHFAGAGGYGADFDAAIAGLSGITALVIDVRSNGGGNDLNAREIAARVADQVRRYAYFQYRNGPGHGDFTAQVALSLGPGGTAFTGPVALLTDRRSYSATEAFVLMMNAFPTVTVVGDSTGGGAGHPLVRELPNGWTFRFSQWLMYTAAGDPFEETGLPPDVWVRGSTAELQAGRDAMLDTALAVVRRGGQPLGSRMVGGRE